VVVVVVVVGIGGPSLTRGLILIVERGIQPILIMKLFIEVTLVVLLMSWTGITSVPSAVPADRRCGPAKSLLLLWR